MKLATNIKQAFSGVFKNKVRTFLAMVGISTAAASIILLVSLGQGVQDKIISQVQDLGANQILIVPVRALQDASGQHDFLRGMAAAAGSLSLEDVQAIQTVPEVNRAAPQLEAVVKAARVNETANQAEPGEALSTDSLLTGTTPAYFDLAKLSLSEGEFLKGEAPQAVLGSAVKERLFGNEPALGQQITLSNNIYTIAGVLAPKESVGLSFNDRVYVPITTAREITGIENLSMIFVEIKSNDLVDEGELGIARAIGPLHKTTDYSLIKQGEMLSLVDKFTKVLTTMLLAIAGISLVIAAIGITNIMMLTAIERTREIGIRKVLGAGAPDIFLQFLFEALIITSIAGIVGILAGYGSIQVLAHYLPGLPFKITWLWVSRTVLAAAGIGIIFGLYPAIRAALMQPARAIRHK